MNPADDTTAEIEYSLLDWGTEDVTTFVEFSNEWPLERAKAVLRDLAKRGLIAVARDADLRDAPAQKEWPTDLTAAVALIDNPRSWEPMKDWREGGNIGYGLTAAGEEEYLRLARRRFGEPAA